MFEFIKDTKNQAIILLSIGLISIFVQNILLQKENYQIKYEYEKSEDSCWLWILDENNNGLATKTDYCGQLSVACTADYHDLDCFWTENPILLDNGTETVVKGCSCKGK